MIASDIIKLANSLYIVVNASKAPGNTRHPSVQSPFLPSAMGRNVFFFIFFLGLITFYLLTAGVGVIVAPDCTYWHIHTRKDSSGRGIGTSQTPAPDNTQKSQQTDIHALGWIRTSNPSQRAATDSHLQPSGHQDRRMSFLCANILFPVSPLQAGWHLALCTAVKRHCGKRPDNFVFSAQLGFR
jgi:hypothetical protein